MRIYCVTPFMIEYCCNFTGVTATTAGTEEINLVSGEIRIAGIILVHIAINETIEPCHVGNPTAYLSVHMGYFNSA